MRRVRFIPWDSRKMGFTPEMFKSVEVIRDWRAHPFGWRVISNGREKTIRTPKEWTAKKQHYYAYVEMTVGEQVMTCRSMSLAALIWLRHLGRSIPAGYVVDHIDENPANNSPDNLQLLSIGKNTDKSRKFKKK